MIHYNILLQPANFVKCFSHICKNQRIQAFLNAFFCTQITNMINFPLTTIIDLLSIIIHC